MKNITSVLERNERWYGYKKFIETRQWDYNSKISLVLCDISPSEYKPFYFGINIIDKIVNNSKYNCGRSIWEEGYESMEWFTQQPIRKFDVIGIGMYMYFQLLAIPAFLADNKIQPLAKFRSNDDPIIILGGQGFYLFNGYDKFVDIACIGEGEEWILEILDICEKYKGNRDKILSEAAKVEGSFVPLIHNTGREIIKKRIVEQENLHNSLLDANCIESKTTRKVIELARGCKYKCGFCALQKRMFPFRENKYEEIIKTINTFKENEHIYPFAPDEASYSKHNEIAKWCDFKGLKYFRYNFRLNTVNEDDILYRNVSNQIVFGIDGISQRIINITNKGIKLDRLTEEIAPLIFKQKYALLKLNYVFNYDFETDEDYYELEKFWRTLIELRIKYNAKTMIRIAPTPFIPEFFIPLQYIKIRDYIDDRFFNIFNKIKLEYFKEKNIIPYFKIEGLQGYENYITAVLMHRIENLSDFVYFCFKNNYKTSKFNKRLYELLLKWMRLQKISKEKLLEELDINNQWHFWYRIDWSAGRFNHIEYMRKEAIAIMVQAFADGKQNLWCGYKKYKRYEDK